MLSFPPILSMTFLFLSSATVRRMSTLPAVRAFSAPPSSSLVRHRAAALRLLPSASTTAVAALPSAISTTRLFSTSSVVEDELDAALEDILNGSGKSSSDNVVRPRVTRPVPVAAEDWASAVAAAASGGDDIKALLATTHPRWVEAGLDPAVVDVLSSKGITHFTPVQAEAFGPIVARRDVIGRSRTGTGKTLAFGLPSLTRIVQTAQQNGKRDPVTGRMARGRAPSMIVMCPTRELARQVSDELSQVAKPLGLHVAVFHGGVSYNPQSDALRNGLDVLVGTPGRILDHLERGNLDLTECEVVVLDEADEMLNMGFADDVETILEGVGSANKEKTQCLLFSATTPRWVQQIGRKYQEDVVQIDSTGEEGGARVATTVRHLAVQLPPGIDSKRAVLEDIIAVEISKDATDYESDDEDLKESNPLAYEHKKNKKGAHTMQQKIFGKTIVFTETKREADELVSGGVFKSLTAQALHGDVGQKQRDATLNAFRAGAFNVLVATDVAARGIDIQDVDLVVQIDPPRDADTYVHRSGRTGRAGRKGISVLMFSPQQARDIVRIEQDLGHDFKFDLVGPPSIEAALKAAARTSAIASKGIPDETAAFFRDAAASLLEEEDDAVDVVARCLAAISRRATEVQSRSLLTGTVGMATVEMTITGGRPVAPNDVMYTVSKLSRMSKGDESLSFESDVGKILTNDSGSAIFDMDVDDAKRLVEFSANIDTGGAIFSLLKELEIERDLHFGRENRRGGPGRFGSPGRGGPGRFGSPDRGGRDFRKPAFRDRFSSGGAMGRDRHMDRNTGNYHGQNHRANHEGRRYITSRSENNKGGESRGRYDGRRGRNESSGW